MQVFSRRLATAGTMTRILPRCWSTLRTQVLTPLHPSDFKRFRHAVLQTPRDLCLFVCFHLSSLPPSLRLPARSAISKYINDSEREGAVRFTPPHEYQSRAGSIVMQSYRNAEKQHANSASHTQEERKKKKRGDEQTGDSFV